MHFRIFRKDTSLPVSGTYNSTILIVKKISMVRTGFTEVTKTTPSRFFLRVLGLAKFSRCLNLGPAAKQVYSDSEHQLMETEFDRGIISTATMPLKEAKSI